MNTQINVLQLICPSGFYGAERWILALAANIAGKDIQCDLAFTSEQPSRCFDIQDRYTTNQGEVFRIEMSGRFDLRVLAQLDALIRRRNIGVIHTHGYKSDLLGVLAARRRKVKVIATPHGFTKVRSIKDRMYHFAGDWALRNSDLVVPLSEELCRDVTQRGVDPKRVELILNGVDLGEVDAALNEPLDERTVSGPLLGYVGQLVPRKRVELLIDTFAIIRQQRPDARLEIYGDGSSREALEKRVAESVDRDHIRFFGYVEDRLQRMRGLDLMLMTSSAEGIPRTLMEGMALGVPCAAFEIDGVRELIEPRVSGLLAPSPDVDNLAKQCIELIQDGDFSRLIGTAGAKRIRQHFSARNMAEQYSALYRQVLHGQESTGS